MKITLLLLALGATLASSVPLSSSEDIQSWDQFKRFFGKSYPTAEEEAIRRQNFENALKYIRENQAKFDHKLAINVHADLSDEELFAPVTPAELTAQYSSIALADQSQFYDTLPTHWDWRDHIKWNPVENQGHCGACWAFATAQTVEAAYAIKHNVSIHLSKQELVDCTNNAAHPEYRNHGCRGGIVTESLRYMKEHGVHTENAYPYAVRDLSCRVNQLAGSKRYQINDYRRLIYVASDTSIMSAVKQYGPVSVNIKGSNGAFKHYHSGVIRQMAEEAGRPTYHSIVLVGWGTDQSGVDYWIVRNSWGAHYGEHGYARIERHHNLFGLNQFVVFPVLH